MNVVAGEASYLKVLSDPFSNGVTNFIYKIVENDVRSGNLKKVVTRFPPEPNGFLHIGHAKAIFLNFELSRKFGGKTNLRFDDSNPKAEDVLFIEAIKRDIKWLGYDWGDNLFFASDYFQKLYDMALGLIRNGYAYVDDQSVEKIRETRGSLTVPGIESPYRMRSVEDNLNLFEKMKNGEFEEGDCVLRAKIDMTSGDMNMRDPILYRIIKHPHPQSGTEWAIYPTYDYCHGQCDSLEEISHSLCSTEFETHRPLYEWFQDKLGILKTRQIEFTRLQITYFVLSKRFLTMLVKENFVSGWDDPRMPTISGLRRRGCPPEALKLLCTKIGLTKRENVIQIELLENCIREVMKEKALKFFAVVDPLEVEIQNAPKDLSEVIEIPNTSRSLTFGPRIFISKSDFMENPTPDYHRLYIGNEIRLKYSYWIKCIDVVKEGDKVVKLICQYDESTKGGVNPPDGRKVKATIHWLSPDAVQEAEFRYYNRLFTKPDPSEGETSKEGFLKYFNKDSLVVHKGYCEKACNDLEVEVPIQFERTGYFTKDPDSTPNLPVFNLTVTLHDTFNQDSFTKQHKEAEKLKRQQAAEQRKRNAEARAQRQSNNT